MSWLAKADGNPAGGVWGQEGEKECDSNYQALKIEFIAPFPSQEGVKCPRCNFKANLVCNARRSSVGKELPSRQGRVLGTGWAHRAGQEPDLGELQLGLCPG